LLERQIAPGASEIRFARRHSKGMLTALRADRHETKQRKAAFTNAAFEWAIAISVASSSLRREECLPRRSLGGGAR
jgi:hypothetical protein